MSLVNVDYKTILFTRYDGINVSLKVNLNNPLNLNEDFLVLSVDGISNPKETKLFYWIDKKRWTINELQFFALNNRLCIKILDKQNTELASYGTCGVGGGDGTGNESRVFNQMFGINFN